MECKTRQKLLTFFLCDNLDLHFHKKQYHIGVCVLLKNLKRLHILGKTHMWFYVCVCVSIYIYIERERPCKCWSFLKLQPISELLVVFGCHKDNAGVNFASNKWGLRPYQKPIALVKHISHCLLHFFGFHGYLIKFKKKKKKTI